MAYPEDRRNPAVETLRSSLADLIAESQALRKDVKTAEDARRRATAVNLALMGLLTLFVGLLLVVGYQNNQVIHKVNVTNQQLADCTTPGGKCYQQGQVRTGQAISDVIRAEIFMAQCARLYPNESGDAYDRKLEACVFARLAGPTGRPTPTPTPGAPR